MTNSEYARSFRFQREKVYALLSQDNPDGLTRLQVARILGIERGSICRRVAELQEEGRLWVIRKGLDPITNTRAEFLTTNFDVAKKYIRKENFEKTGTLF